MKNKKSAHKEQEDRRPDGIYIATTRGNVTKVQLIVPKRKKAPDPIEVVLTPGSNTENLHDNLFLDYDDLKEKREFDLGPPLKPALPLDKLDFVIQFLKNSKPETLEKFFNLATEESGAIPAGLDVSKAEPAAQSPAPCPADTPPLWAERTTGREVSPVDWIKAHYGNKDPYNWDPMGLTRDVLAEVDPPLARAYAKMISRDRESALPSLPPKDVVHIADPVLALARKKQQVQEASARYRKRISSRHIA